MKTFAFNINDWWFVTLTEKGAETLNKLHRKYHEEYPGLALGLRTDYKAGEEYKQQGWSMMQIFSEDIGLGLQAPFLYCKIVVESSLEQTIKE